MATASVTSSSGASAADTVTPVTALEARSDELEVRGLSKRFTGTLALDRVDFTVHRGEVHALLGQNGAGKSTLIKLLAGVYAPSAGEILLDGRPVVPGAEHLPINFIHQDLGLVDSMTVAENVAILAGYPRRHGLIDWKGAHDAAARALAAMGAEIDPGTRVASPAAAEKSIVAIARALSLQCDFVVLDEPTAALPEADVARLMSILDRLRTSCLGIVYVTHRLDEVFRIADRVTVLRDGRKVATLAVGATTPGSLVAMIVGRAIDENGLAPAPTAQPVLQLEDLRLSGVGPVSLGIGAGRSWGSWVCAAPAITLSDGRSSVTSRSVTAASCWTAVPARRTARRSRCSLE